MAPTSAHRGDAHRRPVIETVVDAPLYFPVFYNHRMLTRSRRVIAHTRTQRAPIFHRSSARPTFVDAHFLSNDDPAPRAPSSARLRSSLHSSRPIQPIAFAFASSSIRLVARVRVARRSSRTRDRRNERARDRSIASARRRRRATTTRDDDDDGRKNSNSKSLKQTGTMADANLRINVRARVPFADKGA